MEEARKIKIAWWGKHNGEEPPLVGREGQGAGGIFFSGCNLRCVFCQNHQISQAESGREYSVSELADVMMELQQAGAATIDLVTPTVWWRPIKAALLLAKEKGLRLPVVWNSNCYEALPILREMDGLVDIYLPDFKYGSPELGLKYSGVYNYPDIALAALKEMLAQTGNFDARTMKGVIVRHLVLPGNVENSLDVLDLLAATDKNICISLMSQYVPVHQAGRFPEINRRLTGAEFAQVYDRLLELGFTSGWVQDENDAACMLPDFNRNNPFI